MGERMLPFKEGKRDHWDAFEKRAAVMRLKVWFLALSVGITYTIAHGGTIIKKKGVNNLKIREFREACGLSQSELARRMGVRHTSVIQWEQGETMPAAAKLPKLADLLHCTIDALFGRDGSAEVTADTAQ